MAELRRFGVYQRRFPSGSTTHPPSADALIPRNECRGTSRHLGRGNPGAAARRPHAPKSITTASSDQPQASWLRFAHLGGVGCQIKARGAGRRGRWMRVSNAVTAPTPGRFHGISFRVPR
jgi:hypothetical protein